MQKLLKLLILLVTLTYLSAQDVWGGVSVASPDNLDALSTNAAGLGIDRGTQFGSFIQFDSVYTYYSASRFNGIGYDLKYNNKSHGLFKPDDFNIGFGFSVFHNTYAGFKWNKNHLIDIGVLYRPINQISLGATAQFHDDFTSYNQSTYGIGIRPLFNFAGHST